MKKMLLLFFIIFAAALLAEPQFETGVGASASMMGGFGVAYRQIDKDQGYQLTAGFLSHPNNFISNAGVQYIKPIHQIEQSRLNLIAGFALNSNYEKDEHKSNLGYALGVGPEVEFTKFYNIRVIVGAPLTLSYSSQNEILFISILPAVSFLYYFQ